MTREMTINDLQKTDKTISKSMENTRRGSPRFLTWGKHLWRYGVETLEEYTLPRIGLIWPNLAGRPYIKIRILLTRDIESEKRRKLPDFLLKESWSRSEQNGLHRLCSRQRRAYPFFSVSIAENMPLPFVIAILSCKCKNAATYSVTQKCFQHSTPTLITGR